MLRVSANDGIRADFTITNAGKSFQVQCMSSVAHGLKDGDRVTACGKLDENGGDVFIFADVIVPDKQMEFSF